MDLHGLEIGLGACEKAFMERKRYGGPDCKSAGLAYGGSNPPLPTILIADCGLENADWRTVKRAN